jgi:hypothetical protein
VATFVLVSGGGHNAWCWDRLVPELEQRGHTVVAATMPTGDPAAGLSEYADAVAAAAPSGADAIDGELILVGHSLAGAYLPLAAARSGAPRIVFLGAYVPTASVSVMPAASDEYADDQVGAQGLDEQGRLRIDEFGPDLAREVFYHDCDDATIAWAVARLAPQGTRVMQEAYPADGWPEGLRSAFVCCSEDRFVPPEQARAVAAEFGVEPVELPGSHSPFLSRPADLADALDGLARDPETRWSVSDGNRR